MDHFIKLYKKKKGKVLRKDVRAVLKLRREVEKAKREVEKAKREVSAAHQVCHFPTSRTSHVEISTNVLLSGSRGG